jgi:p-aminobenzoyl-glutamate transporter AbgT
MPQLSNWTFWISALAVPVGASAWYVWQLAIKPRLVPRDKIKRMADELEAQHGDDAEDIAFTEEDSAWRRSETFQQGLWHQVRLELYRRRKG